MNGYTAICVYLGIATVGFLIHEAMEQGRSIEIKGEVDPKTGKVKGELNLTLQQPSVAATSSDYSLSALPA